MKISKAICMACCGKHKVMTGIDPLNDFRKLVPWNYHDEERWKNGLIHCPNFFREHEFREKGIPVGCLQVLWQEDFVEGRCLPVMDESEVCGK
jgi:hypothetical protein